MSSNLLTPSPETFVYLLDAGDMLLDTDLYADILRRVEADPLHRLDFRKIRRQQHARRLAALRKEGAA